MQSYSAEQKALLNEEIQEAELSELLNRMSASELGGSDNPTIGAVVEATGADPRTVASLLAEIRKESFENQFSQTFGDHERRITQLEDQPTARFDTGVKPYAADGLLQDVLDRERRRRDTRPIAIFLAVLVGIIFLIALMGRTSSSTSEPGVSYETTVDGKQFVLSNNGLRVRQRDGSYRTATAKEEQNVLPELMSLRAADEAQNRRAP